MKIFSNSSDLIKFINNETNLGFVPTMGSLHVGHVSLIKKSISQCNKTVISIFVNKPQFNNKGDFRSYPKTLRKDIFMLKKFKVDYLFSPKEKEIYPNGVNKKIKVNSIEKNLCGKFRPGHFKAVVDVIERFVKIIKPNKIYLGEKDFQQLKIIEDYLRKKKNKVKIVPCKTMREKNGIPYSSRNSLLTKNEKIIASKIYRLIHDLKYKIINKKISIKIIKKKIYLLGVKKIDYLEIIDVNKFIKPYKKKNKYKIFIAYYLGLTRLIDNI